MLYIWFQNITQFLICCTCYTKINITLVVPRFKHLAPSLLRSNKGDEDDFDQCLRCERVKIENALGILKNRWSVLRALHPHVKHE